MALEQVLRDLLGLGAVPVPVLRAQQLDLREFLHRGPEGRELVHRRRRPGDRQHRDDPALAAHVLEELAGDHVAEDDLVDEGIRHGPGTVGEAPAGVDGGNALRDGFLQRRLDRLLVDGPVEDQGDVLADQVLDVGHLLAGVEARVGDEDLADLLVPGGLVSDVL